jgi:hypothetical protein
VLESVAVVVNVYSKAPSLPDSTSESVFEPMTVRVSLPVLSLPASMVVTVLVEVAAYCLRSSARPETLSVTLDAGCVEMKARGPWRASTNGRLPIVGCESRPPWRAIRLEWELDLVLEKVDR